MTRPPRAYAARGDEQVIDQEREEREAFAGVLRFYELAKRQEWQVRDLPWGDIPPIPEGKGSPERKARRRDMWRSVLTQQLQADMLACEMASQLLNIAPDPEAKLYYSTMVQDESRHTEAWLKLIDEAGGTAERDPYLDELAHMTLEADTLEEKVFQMQVFYERLIISRFRLIARARRAGPCSRTSATGSRPTTASTTAPGWPTRRCCSQNADKKTKRRSSRRRTACCRSSSSTRSGGRRSARSSAARCASRDTEKPEARTSRSACAWPSRSASTSATSSSRF